MGVSRIITGACGGVFPISNRFISDQATLDVEINKLRDGLRPKVAQLHKMEGKSHTDSYNIPCLYLLSHI